MKNKTAWKAILDIANNLGWPESYRQDLYHDFILLQRMPEGEPFGFAIRDLGTHIFDRYQTPYNSWFRACHKVYGENPRSIRYFWFDGYAMHPVHSEELGDLDRRLCIAFYRYIQDGYSDAEAERAVRAEFNERYGPYIHYDVPLDWESILTE